MFNTLKYYGLKVYIGNIYRALESVASFGGGQGGNLPLSDF